MKWIELKNGKLKNWNFKIDTNGLDLARQTQIKS